MIRKSLFLVIGLTLAGSVSAQARYDDRYDDRYAPPRDVPSSENVNFAYADVLRSSPVYETFRSAEPREECYEERVERRGGDGTGGAVLGAIIGGALGNQVGKGDGRKAATVAGAVIGGAIGHDQASRGDRYDGVERRCRVVDDFREERRLVGYDVEYRYRGEVYMSRLEYDPGDKLRVRVSVTPAE
jgi:uncharacterized protein YcfJ